MLGIYIHIPFCGKKCPYCDFYSRPASAEEITAYLHRVTAEIGKAGCATHPVDTIYFGGGTPSRIGAPGLLRILQAIQRAFPVTSDAEITCEVNPETASLAFFSALLAGGFNRISMGMQSANEAELRTLGRPHNLQQVRDAVSFARAAGFTNISVDLMLALPSSSCSTLSASLREIAALKVPHVSAYLLKVEAGTPFHAQRRQLSLPSEEDVAAQYQLCWETLTAMGYEQYEISNFAKPGYACRHNLHYWRCEPYLGFGPGAHSFYEGNRFFYPADLSAYLDCPKKVPEGAGGSFEEYAMLALRLTEGLQRAKCAARFPNGGALYDELYQRRKKVPPAYLTASSTGMHLTPAGFVVANSVLGALLF